MAASSLNLKQLPRLLPTSSLRPMAASSLNLKQLPRLLRTSSLKNLPSLLHTSCLRPMTLRATSSSFPTDAERTFYETFDVECEPKPSEKPDLFLYHEFLVRGHEDGFNVRLYMAGVKKENVKVWIDHDELIAEGIKEKDIEGEDDDLIRYRMSRPPADVFDLDPTRAEIKSGILTVFVPRKD